VKTAQNRTKIIRCSEEEEEKEEIKNKNICRRVTKHISFTSNFVKMMMNNDENSTKVKSAPN
jgi:hypothetical protein